MNFLRNVNPAGAIADFRQVFRDAGSNRWRFAVLAAFTTFGIFSLITGESWKKPRALPTITYINSWPEDRTEAETRAFIAENQKRKEANEALQRAQEEEGKRLWKALGRASGMDVDAIERKAKADQAAEEAAKAEGNPPAAPASGAR